MKHHETLEHLLIDATILAFEAAILVHGVALSTPGMEFPPIVELVCVTEFRCVTDVCNRITYPWDICIFSRPVWGHSTAGEIMRRFGDEWNRVAMKRNMKINCSLLKENINYRLKVQIIYVGREILIHRIQQVRIFMCKLEWCIGATVVTRCGAGQEEGFTFRGVRDQREKD